MNDKLITSVAYVIGAIIGVAIIAVFVSSGSNTQSVATATGSAFSQALCTALSPLSGAGNCGGGFATSTISFDGF
jgi:hypothetical protein